MKTLFKAVIFLLIISVLLGGCSLSKRITFGKLEAGENFLGSRDGYFKKLPHDYCLNVTLLSKTSLFRIPPEYVNVEWSSSLCCNNILLEGHYIKGFFTPHYLALCEELEDGELMYLTFCFSSEQVQYHDGIKDVYKLLNVDSILWFSLCNTNQEAQRVK